MSVRPLALVVVLLAVVGTSVSVVYSKHKARKLFIELEALNNERDDMDIEWGQLQLEQSTLTTQGQVEAERTLGLQIRIADLERQVAGVRSEEVELLQGRIPRRPGHAGGDDEVVVGGARANQRADRPGELGEVAGRQRPLRLERRQVHAPAKLQREMRPGQLLVEEGGDAPLIHGRRQRLGSGR